MVRCMYSGAISSLGRAQLFKVRHSKESVCSTNQSLVELLLARKYILDDYDRSTDLEVGSNRPAWRRCLDQVHWLRGVVLEEEEPVRHVDHVGLAVRQERFREPQAVQP